MGSEDQSKRWGDLGVHCGRRPGRTVVGVGLLSLLALFSALRLQPSASLDSLYDAQDPASVAMKHLAQDFSAADELTLYVRLPEDLEADGPAIQSMLDFSQRLQRNMAEDSEAAERVVSITDRPSPVTQQFLDEVAVPSALYYLDDAQFQAFRKRLGRAGMEAQMKRNETLVASASPLAKQILQDPLRLHEWLLGRLGGVRPALKTHEGYTPWVSPDGRGLLIRLRAQTPVGDMDQTKALMAMVRRLVAESAPGPLRVDYAGGHAMAELSEREIRHDMMRSVIASLILLQLAFWLAYRGWSTFPMAILPVVAGLVLAFGLYGLGHAVLTPVTAVIGALLAGLGVDYCIHYISHYRAARMEGLSPLEAVGLGRGLGRALVAACVTSVIAFGVIWVSQIQALRAFSLIGVMGLVGAFFGAVTLLPALLVWMDRWDGRKNKAPIRIDAAPLVRWVHTRRRAVMWGGWVGLLGTLAVAASDGSPLARFDDGLWQMHPRPNPPIQTQVQINRAYNAPRDTLLVHVMADDEAALLVRAHQVAERLAGREADRHVLGIHTLLPDPRRVAARRNALADIDVDRVVADFQAVVAQSIFQPMVFDGYLEKLKNMLRPGAAPDLKTLQQYPALATSLLPKASAPKPHQALAVVQYTKSFEKRADRETAAQRIVDEMAEVDGATLTGMSVVGAKIRNAVSEDLPKLMLWALGAVFVWLLLIFKRVDDVVLALVPMLFGLAILMAGMHWSGTEWHMVNLLVVPLLIGIGVDDGIFLVAIAARGRRESIGVEELVRRLAASGHAITMTSLTTGLAFGSLLFTSTPAMQSLGTVFAWGIAGCWLGSVFWLVSILLLRHRGGQAA